MVWAQRDIRDSQSGGGLCGTSGATSAVRLAAAVVVVEEQEEERRRKGERDHSSRLLPRLALRERIGFWCRGTEKDF